MYFFDYNLIVKLNILLYFQAENKDKLNSS